MHLIDMNRCFLIEGWDNNSYTMFAKSKLAGSPSSKATTNNKPATKSHYPHQTYQSINGPRFFPRQSPSHSPDYAQTKERIDYRHRNHTENKYNRQSAVTINPRNRSLNTHSQSLGSSIKKKYSLRPQEDSKHEKLLMIREERIDKIRHSFALKNRMNAEKKVHASVTGNARFNSFTQLARKLPPAKDKDISVLDTQSQPPHKSNAPKFFDFCESNRYREPRANTEQPYVESNLPKVLNRGGKVRSMKKIPETPPLRPVTIEKPTSPQISLDWIMGSYKPYLQIFEQISKEHFNIRKMQKGVYFGELKDDIFEGKGIIFYHNGKIFQGNFANGHKQGLGYECYPDRSSYLGNFANGRRNGRGRFQWSNGQVYDGEWKDGKKEGSGIWKGQGEVSYVGEWKYDTIEGFGVLSEKGSRYEGEFKGFVKYGNGTIRFQNGEIYTGSFRQNLPNGQGDYYWPNGDNYHGQFLNGKRHGQGVLRLASGGLYRGEFKNDKKSGCGEQFYQENLHYQGMFENDLKHGWGRLSTDGRVLFEGYWVNNSGVQAKGTFQSIAEQESMYERDQSNNGMKKNESSASMLRQKFMGRKLGYRKSLSKDRLLEGLPEVKPFRRACNCQRHRKANQEIS